MPRRVEYLGALGMYVPLATPPTTAAANAGQATFGITLQGERVIAVEVVVPGTATPNLQVSKVTPVAAPSGLVLNVGMVNAGNGFAHGSGVVAVDDTNTNLAFSIGTFVSHTSITYRVPWTRTVVPGDHNVSVRLTYDGRVTTWNGTISIAGALQNKLERALHQTSPHAPGAGVDRLVEHAARGRRRTGGARVCGGCGRAAPPPARPGARPLTAKSSAESPRG